MNWLVTRLSVVETVPVAGTMLDGWTNTGRPASPAELAPFLVYLASTESDYMTGQMYMVDGGQVLV